MDQSRKLNFYYLITPVLCMNGPNSQLQYEVGQSYNEIHWKNNNNFAYYFHFALRWISPHWKLKYMKKKLK